MIELHKNIKAARKAAGLGQAELADKVELSVSAISLYEAGKRTPPLAILQSIAMELNTDIKKLIGNDMTEEMQLHLDYLELYNELSQYLALNPEQKKEVKDFLTNILYQE